MYISLQEVLKLPAIQGARVIAGSAYLSNAVKWYHVIEIEEMGNWIDPGTLILLTGVGLVDAQKGLINIITTLSKKHAAGLIINVGPYIPEIEQDVCNLADSLRLPIIVIPTVTRLLDVTYQLSSLLLSRQSHVRKQNDLILELILSSRQNEGSDISNFLDNRFPYYSCLIRCSGAMASSKESSGQLLQTALNHILGCFPAEAFLLSVLSDYLLLFPVPSSKNPCTMAEDVLSCFFEKLNDIAALSDCDVSCGVSRYFSSSTLLRESYHQAEIALRIAQSHMLCDSIVFYERISVFRIIDWNQTREIERITEDFLGGLRSQQELLKTLIVFLEKGKSTKAAAAALHLHVNTVKYRMDQIHQLLPIQPESSHDWFALQAAVYLYLYLKGRG